MKSASDVGFLQRGLQGAPCTSCCPTGYRPRGGVWHRPTRGAEFPSGKQPQRRPDLTILPFRQGRNSPAGKKFFSPTVSAAVKIRKRAVSGRHRPFLIVSFQGRPQPISPRIPSRTGGAGRWCTARLSGRTGASP